MTLRFSSATALLLSATALLCTSCRKPEIRVYLAPKDPPPSETPHTADDGHDHSQPERPRPKVTWTLPAGWLETAPASVSVAAFSVKGDGGEAAVTITPLPNLAGQEAMVVNMYRQQAGLEPIEQSAIDGVLTPVEVAGAQGRLLEINGTGGDKPVRIVTAIAHRDGQSWFYRIAGDDAVVAAQKPVFLDFIKTVRIEAAAPPSDTLATDEVERPKFNWTVPEGWKPVAAGQMQVAKFSVPERDGAKAEVSVSIFPTDTGGTLANVNRWCKQLGLPEVDAATLPPLLQPLDPALSDATLVTLKQDSRALLGAIVPRGGQWWFYKIMGDAAAVTAQRESFIAFAKAQP